MERGRERIDGEEKERQGAGGVEEQKEQRKRYRGQRIK